MLIHGLFMDAMKWDDETMMVADSIPGEMNPVSSTINTIVLLSNPDSKCTISIQYLPSGLAIDHNYYFIVILLLYIASSNGTHGASA